MNIGVPEIAFFKWQRNRGVAEMRLFEFDGKTDAIVNAPPTATGRAKLDKFTVLAHLWIYAVVRPQAPASARRRSGLA